MSGPIDVSWLNQLGEFCVTYGPWAVAIFEGLYILKKEKDHKKVLAEHQKEREEWEALRTIERTETIDRYQDYHNEIVGIAKNTGDSITGMAARMMVSNKEVMMLRKAMEQFLSLIAEGIIRVKDELEIPDDIEETISDFMPENYLKFKKPKNKC
ncbi:hypothetical protein DRQ25_01695 [Candidatus Fermentibacteria bacterium]|nr:MAG: hypothetical protein DRQ25_01695 [Candidatus Fermentibacteria bacterium]